MTIPNTLTSSINEENWALIPSDPAIFDDMIQQYGTRDTKVQELFTLDFDDLAKDAPVHGLIFISRYIEDDLPDNFEEADADAQDIIFTCQVVTNVCGTLALLAVLFNAEIEKKGQIVEHFLDFTKDFNPVDRGVCLGNSTEIRRIHDAYATAHHKAETAFNDTLSEAADDDDGVEYIDNDDYHYVTYIYKNGFIWELDGLKKQPVKICKCDKDNWLESAKPYLQKRMDKSQDSEITFSLMAVTHDSFAALNRQKEILKINTEKLDKVLNKEALPKKRTLQGYKSECLKASGVQENVPIYADMEKIWNDLIGGKHEDIKQDVDKVREYHADLEGKLQQYNENRLVAQHDVIRQKFDYFPFLNTLGQILHNTGLIEVEDGKEKPSSKAKATKAKATAARGKSATAKAKTATSKSSTKKRKAKEDLAAMEMEDTEEGPAPAKETKRRKKKDEPIIIAEEAKDETITILPEVIAKENDARPIKNTIRRKTKTDPIIVREETFKDATIIAPEAIAEDNDTTPIEITQTTKAKNELTIVNEEAINEITITASKVATEGIDKTLIEENEIVEANNQPTTINEDTATAAPEVAPKASNTIKKAKRGRPPSKSTAKVNAKKRKANAEPAVTLADEATNKPTTSKRRCTKKEQADTQDETQFTVKDLHVKGYKGTALHNDNTKSMTQYTTLEVAANEPTATDAETNNVVVYDSNASTELDTEAVKMEICTTIENAETEAANTMECIGRSLSPSRIFNSSRRRRSLSARK